MLTVPSVDWMNEWKENQIPIDFRGNNFSILFLYNFLSEAEREREMKRVHQKYLRRNLLKNYVLNEQTSTPCWTTHESWWRPRPRRNKLEGTESFSLSNSIQLYHEALNYIPLELDTWQHTTMMMMMKKRTNEWIVETTTTFCCTRINHQNERRKVDFSSKRHISHPDSWLSLFFFFCKCTTLRVVDNFFLILEIILFLKTFPRFNTTSSDIEKYRNEKSITTSKGMKRFSLCLQFH